MSLGSLGRLGIEIYADTAQFTGDLGKAEQGAKQFATNVEASLNKITGVFTGIAASLGLIKFAGMIDEVAKMRAGLDDLADAGLGTVESLSRIKNSAKAFGTDFDELTKSLSKMVNGLAGSEKETSKAGEALRRLGISSRDSSGALRAPAEIFEQLAGALDGYADGADKATFAQAILGKGGERYLPMLKDMVEFGAKAATVTAQQAAEADLYDKTMRSLATATQSVAKKIAGEFIPAVTAFAGALTDTINANNGFKKSVGELAADGSLQDWARTAGGAVANLVDVGIGAVRAFEIFGKAIGETGRNAADFGKIAAGALLTMGGNSVAGLALIKDGYSGLKTMGAGFKDDLDAIANRAWFSDAYAARYAANMKKLGEAAESVKPKLNSAGLGTADPNAKTVADPFPAMMAEAQKQLATAYEETLDPLNELTKAEKALIAIRESVNWDQISTAQRIQIRETLEQAAALQKVVAGQKEWNKTVDEAQKFADEFNKKQDDQTAAINAKATAINTEADNWGKLPSGIAAVTLAENEEILARLKLSNASDDLIVSQENLVKSQRNYVAALQRKEGIQAGEQMLKVWDDVATAGGRFFADLVMNGKSAFSRLRDSLKSFAADLIALFAKKWILNMVGNALSGQGIAIGGSLLQLAGSSGAGTLAGSALSGIGSLFGGGATGGAGIWAGAGYGEAAAGAAGAAGGGILSSLSAAVPYLAAIAAAYALIKKFGDKGENPKAQLGFGGNADAYVTQGVFGAEGFKSIQTDDAFNQSLRAYFASFKGMDEALAKMLTDSQQQRIRDALGSQGQREFAFPKGDGTAGEQLSVEYLKQKYSVIFGELDKSFADFVSGFTGSAADLQKAIAEEAAALEMLDSAAVSDMFKAIPDLTIDGLRKIQQAGEALSDTFTRVVNEFLTAQNNLNSAIAARNPQFARDLVLGQRNTLGAQFAASIGQQYDGNLAAQMALNPQSFTGLNTLQMGMLAQWLGLQTQLEQLDQQLAQNANAANNVTTSFNNAATAADDYAAKLHDSQSSLAGFLRGSIISSSPLSAQEKYNEARRQLEAQFAIAEGNGPGAIDARAGLGNFLQQFWDLSRNLVGSSGQGINDYWSYYNRAASLTGGQVQPYSQQDGAANTQAVVAALNTVAEKAAVNAQATVALANMLAEHGLEITSPTLLAALDAIRTGNTAATTGGVLA